MAYMIEATQGRGPILIRPSSGRVCCFGCLKGVSKSVQVLCNGIEAVMVLISKTDRAEI